MHSSDHDNLESATVPKIALWTRRDLARAAWTMTGMEISGFNAWWSTRAKAMAYVHWGCPPLILAIAAWNGARGRDSLASMPPEDGVAFEQWYGGLTFELIDEETGSENQTKVNARASLEVLTDVSGRSGDKFFFSPDVGRPVWRNDSLYTQYGEVLSSGAFVRMMPIDNSTCENYADWTEEYRHEIRQALERQRQLEEIEKTVRQAYRDTLVEQIRVKLPKEEFDAVYDQGFTHGRGY